MDIHPHIFPWNWQYQVPLDTHHALTKTYKESSTTYTYVYIYIQIISRCSAIATTYNLEVLLLMESES